MMTIADKMERGEQAINSYVMQRLDNLKRHLAFLEGQPWNSVTYEARKRTRASIREIEAAIKRAAA